MWCLMWAILVVVCVFFLGSFGFGRCSGFWCGCFWISMVFFLGQCLEVEGEREEKEERERERERDSKKNI